MKTNVILLTIFCSFLFFKISAQPLEYKWASAGIGRFGGECTSLKTDNKGNIYMAGTFESLELVFGSIKLSKTSNPREMFIAKFDSLGVVQWAVKAGGPMAETLSGMDVDKDGNVYVCGFSYSNVTNFGKLKIEKKRSFVAKYDNKGNAVWVNGYYISEFNDLVVGSDGNPVVTGWYMYDSFKLGNFLLCNKNPEQQQILTVKYSSTGEVLYAKSIGGSDYTTGKSITCDANGNIFVAVNFASDTLIVDNVLMTERKWANGGTNFLVVKYDGDGNFKWAKAALGDDINIPHSICCDKNGNVYIGGYFKSYSLKADSFTLVNNSTSSIKKNEFLLKYTASGKFCYLKQFDKTEVGGITADENENVFIYGIFNGDSVKIGPSVLRNPDKEQLQQVDFFITSLNKNGEFKWITNFGDGDFNLASPIINDGKGTIYFAGTAREEKNSIGSLVLSLPKDKAAVFVAKIKVTK